MSEATAIRQLSDAIHNYQNFCVIEQRKAPCLYATLCAALSSKEDIEGPDKTVQLYHRDGPDGSEIIVAEEYFYEEYIDLVVSRAYHTRHAFQYRMGILLGYSEESCLEFVQNPVECSCEKCGGQETLNDKLLREQWIKGGALLRDIEYSSVHPAITGKGPDQQEEDGRTYNMIYKDGEPWGKQYHVHEPAIRNNPALQPWSV